MEIILQETDQDILDLLKYALQFEGFSVFAVQNFETNFLDIIEDLRPHVIMLDYRLDGNSCVRICREIKERFPHLPVLALSCNHNINDVYDQHGFDDYISKPFDLSALYKVLRKYIPQSPMANGLTVE
jgi:DNA-binding response OmpR family regulator